MNKIIIIFAFTFWYQSHGQQCTQQAEKPIFRNNGEMHCADPKHMKLLSKLLKHTICAKPKEILVDIEPENSSYTYLPSKVKIHRCSGHCSHTDGNVECIPVAKETISVPVRRFHRNYRKSECGYVEIEQHVTCQCGCKTMPRHCNEKQKYSEEDCQCLCKEVDTCKNPNEKWDFDECKCK